MDKAPDAYRTISEVADELDLPQHVLRFWETRFAQIRPLKRGGGRRYYRPDDIDLLRGIRHLLYGQGYTIRGVQRIIKESGVKAIQALGRGEGLAAPAKPGGPDVVTIEEEARARHHESPRAGLTAGLRGLFAGPSPMPARAEPPLSEQMRSEPVHSDPVRSEPVLGWPQDEAAEAPLAAEPAAAGFDDRFEPEEDTRQTFGAGAEEEPQRAAPTVVARPAAPAAVASAAPDRGLPYGGAGRPGNGNGNGSAAAPAFPAEPASAGPDTGGLARGQTLRFAPAVLAPEDVRRLQAALYELTECRRRLDAVLDGA